MKKETNRELPIRSKVKMIQNIIEILDCLQHGERRISNALISDLKSRSIDMDEKIQQDVLKFVEQVQFQFAYDPWHKLTEDVTQSADKLIEDLGFKAPAIQSA